MEEKTRQQLLEEILQRFCRVKILNFEVINDLLSQLKQISTSKGDEEKSLLFMVRLAKKELKKHTNAASQSERTEILRRVLRDITNDLTTHLRIYFPA